MELNENRARLRRRGFGLAAVSYDSPAILKHFADRKSIAFPLLSDPDSATIRAFGILNEEIPAGSPFFGVPHPVTYMIDATRTVTTAHTESDFRTRLTTGAVLSEPAPGGGSRIRTPHVTITASASDRIVRGGDRIRLFLDVEPRPKMHLYAPGVEGYIPVAWNMTDSPALTWKDLHFPPGSRLHLEAIGETVPVYQRRFRLYRDVVIGQPKQVRSLLTSDGLLTIEGRFRYQACDEKKCYLPEDVSVRWGLQYQEHDPTRAPEELRRLR